LHLNIFLGSNNPETVTFSSFFSKPYVAKFSDRNSCINLLKTYGQDNSQAYCAFASQDANTSPDRLYFKEISTPSTPSVATTTVKDYSWLSERLVTDSDLDAKDGFELDIMRNSIFALHGRRFDTPGLQKYFDSQPWYRPTYSPQEFPANLLSEIERQNVEYIAKYQDRYQRRYFKK
jgi:serine/threonine-protein kinase